MMETRPRRWDGPGLAVLECLGMVPAAMGANLGGFASGEVARNLFSFEALQPTVTHAFREEVEPFSLQWFLNIENQRHSKQGRWIPKLLEFTKHQGERLLGLGHGLGTDWVQYAAHGAEVVVCSSSASQMSLVRRNFELRGLEGRFINARPANLPLDACSIDVVCLSSLFHGIDHLPEAIQEVYRVLKPGGKVLAVTPAYYDVDFWVRTIFFWNRWLGSSPRQDNPEKRHSARGLKRLFHRFVDHRVHKRQLRGSELPHLWRWLPQPLMARLMGRVLVMKAFKPLKVEG